MTSYEIEKRLKEKQEDFLKTSPRIIEAIKDFQSGKINVDQLTNIYNNSLIKDNNK